MCAAFISAGGGYHHQVQVDHQSQAANASVARRVSTPPVTSTNELLHITKEGRSDGSGPSAKQIELFGWFDEFESRFAIAEP
jgi:hypothetical protein